MLEVITHAYLIKLIMQALNVGMSVVHTPICANDEFHISHAAMSEYGIHTRHKQIITMVVGGDHN